MALGSDSQSPSRLDFELPPVDDRIAEISEAVKQDRELREQELPGLAELLDDYLAPDVPVTPEDFLRRFLHVFRASKDNTYQALLQRYSESEQHLLDGFVTGNSAHEAGRNLIHGLSVGIREEFQNMRDAAKVVLHRPHSIEAIEQGFSSHIKDQAPHMTRTDIGIYEKDSPLEVYKDAEFRNWGLTVENRPRYTCVPKTVYGVQQVVKYAKAKKMGVRVSGYRHSWSPTFGRNGDILISTLNVELATEIPNITSLGLDQGPSTELNAISFVPTQLANSNTKLVRVGCSTTNEQLREWCIEGKMVTLPLNVIMVEITLGGSNGPICHGAGRKHKTLSDLVRRIEYVDAHGEAQVIDQTAPEFLAAASGCFGMMGVITHLTLALDVMTFAVMKPRKVPVVQAIPPPAGYVVPEALQPKVPLTPAEMAQAQAEFERRATNDYYAEWFWFPYSDYAWINTWETTTDPEGTVDYPDQFYKVLQLASSLLLQVLQETAALTKTAQWFPLVRTTLICEIVPRVSKRSKTLQKANDLMTVARAAMMALPPFDVPIYGNTLETIKTWLPDALHFQRAIQNIRVRDVEVEIPLLPSSADPTKPDYTVVQKAWWDAILHAYKYTDTCPQRMPLEMRIMGDSNVIMAPQRGNSLGTCSIEILTLQDSKEKWHPYAQEMLDTWMSYEDSTGERLNTRPHWAKEWYDFTVDGKPWLDHLKEVSYKEEIKEFKAVLSKIGEQHGWTLSDIKERFSNDLYDQLIFDDAPSTAHALQAGMVLAEKDITNVTTRALEALEST